MDNNIERLEDFNINPKVDYIEEFDGEDEEFEQEAVQVIKDANISASWHDYLQNAKSLNRVTGFMAVPMICQGRKCPYADYCPILKNIDKIQETDPEAAQNFYNQIVGKQCRLDKIEAIKYLVELTKELSVDPKQATDLANVMGLIILYQIRRKILWEINLTGFSIDVPAFGFQKTGKVVYRKEAHPLVKMFISLEDQINKTQNQLMASRAAQADQQVGFAKVLGELLKDVSKDKKRPEPKAFDKSVIIDMMLDDDDED